MTKITDKDIKNLHQVQHILNTLIKGETINPNDYENKDHGSMSMACLEYKLSVIKFLDEFQKEV